MSTVNERIKALVKASGLSNRELARRLGTTHVTVSNWVNGHSEPNDTGLEKFCEFFEVTPAYVKYGDGNVPHGQTIMVDDTLSIPYISATASAGYGNHLNGDELVLIRFIKASVEYIRNLCPTANINALQILSCSGDSMMPTLAEGDSVIVDVSKKEAKKDGLYVVRIRSELFIKRIQVLPNGLRLTSDNEFYAPMDVQDDDIAVIGRAYLGLCVKRL